MRRLTASIVEAAAPWCVLLVMLGIAIMGIVPPTAVPADGDPTGFSAERALEHVAAIAAEPRPIGSPGSAAAREYLVDRLQGLGLEPSLQKVTVPDYYGNGGDVQVVNVIARIDGSNPAGAIVLIGHYDTFPNAPGANDNATAVAAAVETGRALLAGPPLRNDVILLLTDGEEPAPRYGSTAFVERHTYAGDIRLAINFEAIGDSGPSVLVEVAGDEGALISHYAAAVPRPVASSVLDDIVELIGGSNTDIAPFRDRGIAAFEFAYLRGSPIYHTAGDDIDSVHLGSLQHHGSHALALTRRFGDLDLAGLGGGGQEVFFTLIGHVVVHYPAAFGVMLGVVAGLLLGLALWMEFRAGRLGARRAAAGVGRLLLTALGIGLASAVVWRLAVELLWRSRGPTGIAAAGWMVMLIAAAIGSTVAIHRRHTKRMGDPQMEWATLTLWWLLAMAVSLTLPGAGYLLVWPVLAAIPVTARRPRAWWARLAALAVVSAPAVVLAVPVLDTFFQMGQPRPGNLDSQIPEMMFVVGLLASLIAALLIPHVRRARR